MSTSVSTQRLGITELGTGFNIDFNDAWHYAIQGMTRSGKSVLVYSLLAPLAACDNVRICGVDPTGILLKPWQEHPGSEYRHLGGKDLQHAADVLASLCDEMDRRIQDMLAAYQDKIEARSSERKSFGRLRTICLSRLKVLGLTEFGRSFIHRSRVSRTLRPASSCWRKYALASSRVPKVLGVRFRPDVGRAR